MVAKCCVIARQAARSLFHKTDGLVDQTPCPVECHLSANPALFRPNVMICPPPFSAALSLALPR
jgi:hypothetical protein